MGLLSRMTNAPVKLGESTAPWAEKPLTIDAHHHALNRLAADRLKQTWAEAAEAINAEQRTRALSTLARMMAKPDAAYYPRTEPGDEPRRVLRQPLESSENSYSSMSSQGDNLFIKKHGGVLVHDDPSMSHSDNERIFRAANITPDKSKRYGYNAPGEDKCAYDLHESTMSAEAMEKLDAIRDEVSPQTWDATMQIVNVVGREVIKEFVRSQYGEAEDNDETSDDNQAPEDDANEEAARRISLHAAKMAMRYRKPGVRLNAEPRPKPRIKLNAEPRPNRRFGGRLPGF